MHTPVIIKETIKSIITRKNGIYIDGTVGRGGHSKIILHQIKKGNLISFDKDPDSISFIKKTLFQYINIKIIHAPFSNINKYCKKQKIIEKISGIIIDMGISKYQIKNSDKGFSFLKKNDLDMRINKHKNTTAFKIIKNYKIENLENIFYKTGEQKTARNISKNIKKQLKKGNQLSKTNQLNKTIQKTINKKQKNHPSKKIFQAIRIHINKELDEIINLLKYSIEILEKKKRITIISFHSLEDSLVKNIMNKLTKIKKFKLINRQAAKWVTKKKHIKNKEYIKNKSTKSATLRTIEKK